MCLSHFMFIGEQEGRCFCFDYPNITAMALRRDYQVEYGSLLSVEQILGTECLLMFSISPLLVSRSLHICVHLESNKNKIHKKNYSDPPEAV